MILEGREDGRKEGRQVERHSHSLNTESDVSREQTDATWCSLRDMRTPGATTRFRRSMSANTHSSLGDVMRKSPLKSAWRP